MFTGIIEEQGRVQGVRPSGGVTRLEIAASRTLSDLEIGGSLAVNGACLTAIEVSASSVSLEMIAETGRRTNLGELRPGRLVNLERPLRAGARLEGHWVQGHVDQVARVLGRRSEGQGTERFEIELPEGLARYVVEKGSIAVDGISLTVGEVTSGSFSLYLIPHTLGLTTLGTRRPGDRVNLEVDILAKYLERLTATGRWEADRDATVPGSPGGGRDAGAADQAGGGLGAFLNEPT